MNASPLETETNADTTTFDHFGRSWTVPTRRHHQHIRETKRIVREEGVVDADDIARIYLTDEQYDALLELNVGEEELTGFATKIAECLGMGGSGNSSPSSTSS